jgi:hypothetical protein
MRVHVLELRVWRLGPRVPPLQPRVGEIEVSVVTPRSRYRVLQFDSRGLRAARIPT